MPSNTTIVTMDEIASAIPGSMPWDFDVHKELLTRPDGTPTDRFAIVRSDDPSKVMGYCSDDYSPVSYEKLIRPVISFIRQEMGNDLSVRYTEKGEGKNASFEIVFGDEKVIPHPEIGLADGVRRSLMIHSSHDLTKGIVAQAGWYRLICTNGLIIPEAIKTYKNRHLSWDEIAFAGQVEDLFDSISANQADIIEVWNRWADTPMDRWATSDLFADLSSRGLPARYIDTAARNLLQLHADVRGTDRRFEEPSFWEAYNALTMRDMPSVRDDFHLPGITTEAFKSVEAVLAA